MMKSVLLAFCVAALGLRVVASSDFEQHCSNVTLSDTILTATCVDDHGTPLTNSINLNYCFENYRGRLKCHRNGYYSNTCSDCRLDQSAYLDCSCGKGGTSYDLNQCIGSSDGRLVC